MIIYTAINKSLNVCFSFWYGVTRASDSNEVGKKGVLYHNTVAIVILDIHTLAASISRCRDRDIYREIGA